jgi:hypothetical protein
MTSKHAIVIFLKEFKELVKNTQFYIVPREKNNETASKLGITKNDQRDAILGLSAKDYVTGPEPDDSGSGEIWVFGAQIGSEIYIKLKIADVGKKKIAKCISFHAAKHPLSHPYK